jgi:hypothetical protein
MYPEGCGLIHYFRLFKSKTGYPYHLPKDIYIISKSKEQAKCKVQPFCGEFYDTYTHIKSFNSVALIE